jgi:hypothetical protein
MQFHSYPVDLRILCIDLDLLRSLRRDSRRGHRLYLGSCLLLRVKRRFRGSLRIPRLLLLVLAGLGELKVGLCADCELLRVVWVRCWQHGTVRQRAKRQLGAARIRKAYTSSSFIRSVRSLLVAIIWCSAISWWCLFKWDLL